MAIVGNLTHRKQRYVRSNFGPMARISRLGLDGMGACLFCEEKGPFKRVEHVVPEALGNDNLILLGEVCDTCNQYFGKEIECFVLDKTPLAFWRTFLGIPKKKGKLPRVNLSQPTRQKGRLGAVHPNHDNLVGFTCHDDYSVSVDVGSEDLSRGIRDGSRRKLTFVFTPLVLSMMGRFFCKVGVELLCLDDGMHARTDQFRRARRFARRGEFEGLWPIFHFQSGTISDLKVRKEDTQGLIEEVMCYSYRLFSLADLYTLLAFTIGIDTWVVSLNDPYPTPSIRGCFPGHDLSLIWYSPEQLYPPQ